VGTLDFRHPSVEGDNPSGRVDGTKGKKPMIILGLILCLLALVTGVAILWPIGVLLIIVGAILWLLGAAGREVGGRRHYY
jgi:hypothetical protein